MKKKTYKIIYFFIALVMTFGMVSLGGLTAKAYEGDCTASKICVTGISVSAAPESVNMGSTLQMNATVTPSDATYSSVTWSVVNGTGEATIDSTTGILTPTSAGKVTVSATSNDDSSKIASNEITINKVVAQIDTVKYSSWQNAVNAVKDNETITLLDNINLEASDTMPAKACIINGSNHTLKLYGETHLKADVTLKDINLDCSLGTTLYACQNDVKYNITVEGTVAVSNVSLNGGAVSNLTVNGILNANSNIGSFQNIIINNNGKAILKKTVNSCNKCKIDGELTLNDSFEVTSGLSGNGTIIINKRFRMGLLLIGNSFVIEEGAQIKLDTSGYPLAADDTLIEISNATTNLTDINKFKFGDYINNFVINGTAADSDGNGTKDCYNYTLAPQINNVQVKVNGNPTHGEDVSVTATLRDSAGNPLSYNGTMEFFVDDSNTVFATANTNANGVYSATLTSKPSIETHIITAKYTSDKIIPVQKMIGTTNFSVNKKSDLTLSGNEPTMNGMDLQVSGLSLSDKKYDGTPISPLGTPVFKNGNDEVTIANPIYLYESTDGADYSNPAPPSTAGSYKLTVSIPVDNTDYTGKMDIPFTINKKEITVKADDKSIYVGGTIPQNSELTYTVTSLIGNDTLKTVPVLTIDPSAVSTSTGVYTINITNAEADSNYIVTMENGSLIINSVVPGAPTIISASAGNTQATISFNAPSDNGGSVITNYTVTSTPGGITASGTSSPITLTGLTNGTSYTFTITATNSAGIGAESVASKSVTPMAPYVPPYIPPTPPPQPITETREIPVIMATGGREINVAELTVTRTTDTKGLKRDALQLDENTAEKIVRKALETKTTSAAILLKDIQGNKADKIEVGISKNSMFQFANSNISLNLQTEKASLELSSEIITKLRDQDIKIQISEENNNSKLAETKGLIVQLASGLQITTNPLNIEADFIERTKITLPIDASKLPSSKDELDKFLSSLAVVVQHSDRENVIDKGTIIYSESGNPTGISIKTDKFGRFALIELPENYFEGRTTVIPDKVSPDKEWQIKFTKAADPDTITNENVYVVDSNGNRVEVNISYDSANILTVTPVNSYESGETYYLYISKNVIAKDKTFLVNKLRYEFTIK